MEIVSIIGNNISKELFLVYGLIIAVILLIAVILIVDKVKSRKKDNLFDSRKLSKRLNNLRMEAEKAEQEEKQETIKKVDKQAEMEVVAKPKVDAPVKETSTIMQTPSVSVAPTESSKPSIQERPSTKEAQALNNRRVEPMIEKKQPVYEEIEILDGDEKNQIIQTNDIDQSIWEMDNQEEIYQETELEKTQAQIDVEAITRELEKAVNDEQAIDKYAKFEEEQEQNAIISYVELKEKFDKLYNENEKTQYINDDTLPINMEELYRSQMEDQPAQTSASTVHPTPSELHVHPTVDKAPSVSQQTPTPTPNQIQQNPVSNNIPRTTRFKSSPMISPVYGIQQEPVVAKNTTNVAEMEAEIQRTNEFLQSLKDLQKNLE